MRIRSEPEMTRVFESSVFVFPFAYLKPPCHSPKDPLPASEDQHENNESGKKEKIAYRFVRHGC